MLAEIRRLRKGARAPSETLLEMSKGATDESHAGPEQDAVAPLEPEIQAPALRRAVEVTGAAESETAGPSTNPEEAVQNPLLESRPWFFPLTPEMPTLISESTDVAFSTRLRQELTGIPQRHFLQAPSVSDEALAAFKSPTSWPAPSRCRFLLRVVFNTLCHRYYIAQKSSTTRLLEQAISDRTSCDVLSTCKLYALFALGELYSTRVCSSEEQFPGLDFYFSATRMLRTLSEQPRIDCVEILNMLVSIALR